MAGTRAGSARDSPSGALQAFPSHRAQSLRRLPRRDVRVRDEDIHEVREETPMTVAAVDRIALESKVKSMYSDVAENPRGEFPFEMGRAMAERLGYAPSDLARIPPESIESFAGVGYFFDLAALRVGESVVDLGSGSGMDSFV